MRNGKLQNDLATLRADAEEWRCILDERATLMSEENAALRAVAAQLKEACEMGRPGEKHGLLDYSGWLLNKRGAHFSAQYLRDMVGRMQAALRAAEEVL